MHMSYEYIVIMVHSQCKLKSYPMHWLLFTKNSIISSHKPQAVNTRRCIMIALRRRNKRPKRFLFV